MEPNESENSTPVTEGSEASPVTEGKKVTQRAARRKPTQGDEDMVLSALVQAIGEARGSLMAELGQVRSELAQVRDEARRTGDQLVAVATTNEAAVSRVMEQAVLARREIDDLRNLVLNLRAEHVTTSKMVDGINLGLLEHRSELNRWTKHADNLMHVTGQGVAEVLAFITEHRPALAKALTMMDPGTAIKRGLGFGRGARQ